MYYHHLLQFYFVRFFFNLFILFLKYVSFELRQFVIEGAIWYIVFVLAQACDIHCTEHSLPLKLVKIITFIFYPLKIQSIKTVSPEYLAQAPTELLTAKLSASPRLSLTTDRRQDSDGYCIINELSNVSCKWIENLVVFLIVCDFCAAVLV